MRSTKVNYVYLEEEEAPPLELDLQIVPHYDENYHCYQQYQLCRKGKLFFAFTGDKTIRELMLERFKKGRDLYVKTRWEERKRIRRENELKFKLNIKKEGDRKKKKI